MDRVVTPLSGTLAPEILQHKAIAHDERVMVTIQVAVRVPQGAIPECDVYGDIARFHHRGVVYRPCLTFEAKTDTNHYEYPSVDELRASGIEVQDYTEITIARD